MLLWSGQPGELPFSYDELAAANEGLVVVAMTPFGLDGPKADWAATDLTICASACQAALTGDSDLAPLRWGSPQAYLHGAADMAVAALVGLTERRRSGRGQLADVSAQASCLQASFCYSLNTAWGAPAMGRSAEGFDLGAYKLRFTYPAADGEVSITFMFGAAMAAFTANLFQWIWEEGGCDEATRDTPWTDLAVQLFTGEVPASEVDRLAGVIAAFTKTRNKAELYTEARRRRVLLAPIATLREVLANDHLEARQFWDHLQEPEAGTATHRYPGRFLVAPAAPLRNLAAAPRLGEHNDTELSGPARPKPTQQAAAGVPHDGRALSDLKVLDLSWSIAGPYVGRLLADFGATVVRVESRSRPDLARTASPFHPGNEQHPLEGSGLYGNSNAGKLGIDVDLSTPAGHEVVWDLIRWADIVVESFSAGTLERMGFGYQRMAEVNSGVILLSSCLPGQTGTLEMPGLGNLTTALFGFTITTGWPGRSSAGPFGAYTDVVSPRFGLAGVLAALEYRRRSGIGQHLDLSQAECALHFLTTALLDAEVNGREFTARGNRDPAMAPHGVFPAAGEDRWVAVACAEDQQWQSLAGRLGRGDLAGLTLAERLARQDELDQLISTWTASREPAEVETVLQAIGVAAHQVQNSAACLADPQLAHRGHYVTLEHPLLGEVTIEGPRFHLSRTPGRTATPSPTYGQHAERVLSTILGYDEERIAELVIAGALG